MFTIVDLSTKLSRDTVTLVLLSFGPMINSATPCESVLHFPCGPRTVAPATLDPKVSLTVTFSKLNAIGVSPPLPPPFPPQADRHRQRATTAKETAHSSLGLQSTAPEPWECNRFMGSS